MRRSREEPAVQLEQERIHVSPLGDHHAVLAIDGDVTRRDALDLQRQIAQSVRRGLTGVIIELRDARAVAPGVLAALLHARRRLLGIGGELTLVCDEELLGVQGLLPTARTVLEARS